MPDLGIIILAAGGSTRMGQAKQLLKINGQSLIRKTAKTALALSSNLVVVLGHAAQEVKKEISDLSATIVINPHWQKGMARSLRLGIDAIQQSSEVPKAVLLLLCDQPLITVGYLQKLYLEFQASKNLAIASEYNNTKGVPAIFDLSTLKQFKAEQGDFGARHLIKQLENNKQLALMLFPEGAIDLDTMEDYEDFLRDYYGA